MTLLLLLANGHVIEIPVGTVTSGEMVLVPVVTSGEMTLVPVVTSDEMVLEA